MKTVSASVSVETGFVSARKGHPQALPFLFLELTKPRLVSLVLWSVAVGFYLAAPNPVNFFLLLKTLGGTALVAGGAMVLNQFLEQENDAKMKRTENRPLASGRLAPESALPFGISLSFLGLLGLSLGVNPSTALLSAFSLGAYLFVYTPLKTKTPLCTLVGAIPGAFPPLLGWAAAKGALDLEASLLFLIIFLWQLPHVLAISWIYREDFKRAGFQMLSVKDPTGESVGQGILLSTLGLFPVSLLPFALGMAGFLYFFGAAVLGLWFFVKALKTQRALDRRAKSFFRSSIVYLALLFLLLVLDKKPL